MLVVDDEPQIVRALVINLRARKYEVDAAPDGATALQLAAARHPDVVVLDLGLPDMDGVEVIKGLRGWTRVPIIVLSARHDLRREGRGAGRRAPTTTSPSRSAWTSCWPGCAPRSAGPRRPATTDEAALVETDAFTVDLAAKKVHRDGADVRLTPTEWHLLEVLVRNTGRLVSQKQLLQEVWGPAYGTETNYLRVYMAQLRRKLEADPSHPGTSSPSPAWATASRPEITGSRTTRRT